MQFVESENIYILSDLLNYCDKSNLTIHLENFVLIVKRTSFYDLPFVIVDTSRNHQNISGCCALEWIDLKTFWIKTTLKLKHTRKKLDHFSKIIQWSQCIVLARYLQLSTIWASVLDLILLSLNNDWWLLAITPGGGNVIKTMSFLQLTHQSANDMAKYYTS